MIQTAYMVVVTSIILALFQKTLRHGYCLLTELKTRSRMTVVKQAITSFMHLSSMQDVTKKIKEDSAQRYIPLPVPYMTNDPLSWKAARTFDDTAKFTSSQRDALQVCWGRVPTALLHLLPDAGKDASGQDFIYGVWGFAALHNYKPKKGNIAFTDKSYSRRLNFLNLKDDFTTYSVDSTTAFQVTQGVKFSDDSILLNKEAAASMICLKYRRSFAAHTTSQMTTEEEFQTLHNPLGYVLIALPADAVKRQEWRGQEESLRATLHDTETTPSWFLITNCYVERVYYRSIFC